MYDVQIVRVFEVRVKHRLPFWTALEYIYSVNAIIKEKEALWKLKKISQEKPYWS